MAGGNPEDDELNMMRDMFMEGKYMNSEESGVDPLLQCCKVCERIGGLGHEIRWINPESRAPFFQGV